MRTHKTAFTLVELIVVITILAILGTIAFISVQSYSANARDSVRIANLNNMDKGLAFLQAKDGTLPEPEGNTTVITLSGSTLMTQGEMTQSMAEQHLKMSGDIVDPADSSNPIYSLSSDKKKYQVALFLEAESLAYQIRDSRSAVPTGLQTTHAADGRTFITRGNKLGIVLNDNETPVNQQTGATATLELNNTTTPHKIYLDNSEVVEGIGEELSSINPVSSCKRILETGGARSANGGDGVYTINPSGTDFSVYCDMSTDGGGWTLAARALAGSSAHVNPNIVGTVLAPTQGTVGKLSDEMFRIIGSEQTYETRFTFDQFPDSIYHEWNNGHAEHFSITLVTNSTPYKQTIKHSYGAIWTDSTIVYAAGCASGFGPFASGTQCSTIWQYAGGGTAAHSGFGIGAAYSNPWTSGHAEDGQHRSGAFWIK